MDVGPFRFYKVERTGTLDISLIMFGNYPFGWEYGWEDPDSGLMKPWVSFRIGKLNIFYFEAWKWGLELWFFGFWVIL